MEYIHLKADTQVLVKIFQKELKHKILSCVQLESRLLMKQLQSDFVNSFQVAIHAIIICDPALQVSQLDKVANTVSKRYSATLLKFLQLTATEFGLHIVNIIHLYNFLHHSLLC